MGHEVASIRTEVIKLAIYSPMNQTGQPLSSGSLHSQVVDTLGQEIVDEQIAPGAVLNPEVLGSRFGVSRSVIRESLRALESMGMVVARPQIGTKVLPASEWNLLHPQMVAWRGRGKDYLEQMEQVLEMRFGIELVAARLATRRMSDASIASLFEALAAMRSAAELGDGTAYLQADAVYHQLLLAGSGNALIAQFSQTVTAVLRTREQDRRRAINELTPQSLQEHIDLAEAVRAREADKAEAALRVVVSHTLREFQDARGESPQEI
jgi:DNA-binding FadR family transcriptional regulator